MILFQPPKTPLGGEIIYQRTIPFGITVGQSGGMIGETD